MTSNRRTGFIVLIMLTIAGAAPIISVIAAGFVAGSLGCTLDEGSIHPCVVAGIDLGAVLYAMGVAGWLMLATGPLLIILILIWMIIGLRAILRRLRQPTSRLDRQ